jgi:integrase
MKQSLAWTTITKIRGIMHRVYRIGILHGHVSNNPVQHVETRSKTSYRAIVITPAQTLGILKCLTNALHYALVLTCAATALRASEMLSLRWNDVIWQEGRIRVSKRWAKGEDGDTKTPASDSYVPLPPVLAWHLREWHAQTPYSKATDFVFPSLRAQGKKPLYASSFVADYLRPAWPVLQSQMAKGLGCITSDTRLALATEQREGRAEDRAGHPAPLKDPDDAGSLYAGR